MNRSLPVSVLCAALAAGGCAIVVTQHNDNGRTGAYLAETSLTPDAVRGRRMRVKFTATVDGNSNINAQPLYMRNVAFAGGRANAFYVVTEDNSVYAFDAGSGTRLWKHALVDSDTTARGLPHGPSNLPVTPVIDVGAQTMYVLFSTKNQAVDSAGSEAAEATLERTLDVAYWLVALDIRSGAELRRTRLQASVTRSDHTTLAFDARRQVNHPALLLDHGSVYAAFGSRWLEGVAEFHGWVMRYDAATLRPQGAFCTTVDGRGANAEGGGIWQGGGGLAADSAGNVYFLVGNAPADPAHLSYGDSFVKLTPSGDTLLFGGSVAPPDAAVYDAKDLDLGSGGLIVIPGTSLLAGGGKTGRIFLVDGATMTILQSFQAFTNTYHPDWNYGCPTPAPAGCADWEAGPHLHGSPTWWRGPNSAFAYFYHWSEKDHLKQFKFNLSSQRFDETPVTGAVRATEFMMPGGLTSLSANLNRANTGVLWAILPGGDKSHLYAFHAESLEPLWDAGLPDATPVMSHHAAPTVADGMVAIATTSGGVVVYELGPVATAAPGRPIERQLPWQPIPPGDPPEGRFSARFDSERSIVALPALRRTELAPPADQAPLFRVRAASDGKGEQFDGGRRDGSTFEAADGSRITAEPALSVPAPEKDAPPWQLFKVTAHEGKGRLDGVNWIQRINTGATRATYVFFGARR